ncbi:MAG: hypothetical protein WKF96_23780 [Solirubrobacteraceae bacterium]
MRTRGHALKRIANAFVELRAQGCRHAELEEWIRAPKLHVALPQARVEREVRAPRPELVRTVWTKLDRELRVTLGAEDKSCLVEAVRAAPQSKLTSGGLFKDFRRLLSLELMVLSGGRVEAIRALNRSDYVKDHVGPPPDHRVGAALLLRPGKTLAEDVVRPKPVPDGLAELIDAYLLFLVLQRAATFDAPESFGPRRPPSRELPSDHPLLVGTLHRLSRWDESAMRQMFSGMTPRVYKHKRNHGVRPLVPRESGWSSELPVEHRPFVGHTPHEFRRLAQQMAETAGALWAERHPAAGPRTAPEPALYGTALLDHKPGGNSMRNLYGDRSQESAYELLSGRAIEYMRPLLTTSAGARRKPDRNRMEGTAERLKLVEAEIGRLHRRAEKLCHARVPRVPPRLVFTAVEEGRSDRQVIDGIAADQRRFAERQEFLIERLEKFRAENEAFSRLLYEQATLNELRNELRDELLALWTDKSTWTIVPDSAPAGADRVDFTLEELMEGRSSRPQLDETATPSGVRDWILPVEQAWIVGVDRGTIVRQMNGDYLPKRPEQRPWEAGAAPVDWSLGSKYRRIWVGGIKETYWRAAERRRRLAAILAGWPDLQGWQKDGQPSRRSLAPLTLEEPFAAARAAQGEGRPAEPELTPGER